MKPRRYYGRPRREMIPFVPAGARAILDVGCGAGAFAAGLRAERGDGLRIEGVELDAEAAALAAEVLDGVHHGDAARILPGLRAGGYDCIVMNDVLEHLLEPAAVLQAARPLLAPGGRLVASLPNVRYFWNVVDLAVRGRWDYTDEGILDRTHLRFFTRRSMLRLFAESGWRVERCTGINPTGSLKFKAVDLLTWGRWSDMRYLQFVIEASPGG